MKRVIMEVFPTPGSPRKTSLYLRLRTVEIYTYFSKGAIRGAPPSVVALASPAALISTNQSVFMEFHPIWPGDEKMGKFPRQSTIVTFNKQERKSTITINYTNASFFIAQGLSFIDLIYRLDRTGVYTRT